MPIVTPDLPQTEAAIVAMTNALRAESKLGAVTPSAPLRMAAQAFAEHLARTGTFSHTADGRQPAERTRAAGYKSCIVAENLAMRQSRQGFDAASLARLVVEGWTGSAPHRANLLQSAVTETGVGIAQSSDPVPRFLAVQVFGRPDSYRYSYVIENRSGQAVSYALDADKRTIAAATVVTQTACAPRVISFQAGSLSAKFETKGGNRYKITRGADGAPHVDRVTSRL